MGHWSSLRPVLSLVPVVSNQANIAYTVQKGSPGEKVVTKSTKELTDKPRSAEFKAQVDKIAEFMIEQEIDPCEARDIAIAASSKFVLMHPGKNK